MQGKLKSVKRRAKRKADSELTSRNRSVYLISPPPVSNTSPIDNVDPPDSVLTIDESDRIFSDNNDDSDEVKIVFQDTQESDSDTIQYLPSPTYHLSPSSDVTTQRLTMTLPNSYIESKHVNEIVYLRRALLVLPNMGTESGTTIAVLLPNNNG